MKKKTPGKTFASSASTSFIFPVRNLKAAHALAVRENYPDRLGVTVWTVVKGARPQVIEVQILRKIIDHLNEISLEDSKGIRVRLTKSTGGLTMIRVGTGENAVEIPHIDK